MLGKIDVSENIVVKDLNLHDGPLYYPLDACSPHLQLKRLDGCVMKYLEVARRRVRAGGRRYQSGVFVRELCLRHFIKLQILSVMPFRWYTVSVNIVKKWEQKCGSILLVQGYSVVCVCKTCARDGHFWSHLERARARGSQFWTTCASHSTSMYIYVKRNLITPTLV